MLYFVQSMKTKRTMAKTSTAAPRISTLHAHVWSALTFAGFIVAYIAAIVLGAQGLLPFAYGAAMLISILLVEALVHGQLWPFADGYRELLADTDGIALRLVFFCGILLLVLESAILISLWV